ncbi:MAG: right-handed parallel beta-helix repeat-containing protein, partial [Candidatus Cloacimonetes bacterium]|nr:right-handed parallel beta-helix repeat-containing protein [Candidatus Cloacimonadota bacterium]
RKTINLCTLSQRLISLWLLLLFFFIANITYATIINVPDDYPTIQEGIDASVNGDTVIVDTGRYYENINYNGKNIVVASLFLTTQDTSYISQTIIDGDSSGSVVIFENDEDSTAVLCGFTIENGFGEGYPYYFGGGITCKNSSCSTLENLLITNNYAGFGGGIYCKESSPIIENVTITDNYAGLGGGIYCSHSSMTLENVNITNNSAHYGGGIRCTFYSSPFLKYVTIKGNFADSKGGGICCETYSSPNLEYVSITDNSANDGGGIYCNDSSPNLVYIDIMGNSADDEGGGIFCIHSNPTLQNINIINNYANSQGGGIYCYDTSSDLEYVTLMGNSADDEGGGIYCDESSLIFENVTITYNYAGSLGGGIYCIDSNTSFSANNLCNIYLNNINNRGSGSDIYSDTSISVVVDTFTVLNPTDFHASPIENFTFDIQHGIQNQVDSDLYVSPDGDNTNSGLLPDDPLKTIQYAMSIILADSLHQHTIYLSEGTYSSSTNGELFPISMPDYISLVGETEESVIINANSVSSVMKFFYVNNAFVSTMTIMGGSSDFGGGIYFHYSSPTIENVTINDNYASVYGGGIYCYENSSLTLENVRITDNYADMCGGGICCYGSNPTIQNVTIINNSATYHGGGSYFYDSHPTLKDVTITDNYSVYKGGGIYFCYDSNPILENVTITYNSTGSLGGGIYCSDSNLSFSDNNRCNIYLNNINNRGSGSDIYSDTSISVVVDTFTVLNPTDFHASPIENFTFDIQHGIQNQVDSDLYVSPDGDNTNSGLSPDDPLKTIQYAMSIILADNLHQHTIHLSEGTYSPSTNGEFFPISISDYISLVGDTEENVIIDADSAASVMQFFHVDNAHLSNMTIMGGYSWGGGGIYCNESNPYLEDVTITNNSADSYGGGICCSNYSSPTLENVTITDNSAGDCGGGIYSILDSSPIIKNSIVSNNNGDYGIYISEFNPGEPTITYSDFYNNENGNFWNCNPEIGINVTTNANGDSCDVFYNIQLDPLFIDPDNGDYHLSWANFPIPDSTKSPCIDAGDPEPQYNDPDGTRNDMGAYYFDQTVGVDDENNTLIEAGLFRNFPNPFNKTTLISYSLPKSGTVKIQIYNIKGQLVETLINENKPAGFHTVEWNAKDMSSGIYFYKLSTKDKTFVKKMIILH